MKKVSGIILTVITVLYPILVFTLLVLLKLPVRVLSLCVMVLAIAPFLSATSSIKQRNLDSKKALDWRPVFSSVLFLIAGLFCFITQKSLFLKLYSVSVSILFLFAFASTFFIKPNIIFRFACMMNKNIIGSPGEKQILKYCLKVTVVWCIFFILNGSISVWTAVHDFGSEKLNNQIWSVYNGGISYVLMGMLFAVELIVRKRMEKKMNATYSFTKFKADSRNDDYIVCFENKWSDGKYKTWKDFLVDSAKIRSFLEKSEEKEWILHCEDYWYFLCTFIALLQCKKCIFLVQNISESYIAEIRKEGTGFITDQNVEKSKNIAQIIEESEIPLESYFRKAPQIDANETQIFMYTSGSTGKPKAVPQRMTEFEMDNNFIISKWGKEFAGRKLITTVSQHHIYGFLFGSSLPFTLGVPFRRTRIEFPEEFEILNDEKYVLVATPAFLKRTVEIVEKLDMKDPWIWSSGGAVSPELAVKVQNLFGFCPLEVYGSTETSGIAFRQQSVDGLKWTPFDNAKIWLGDDGCLRIISPYIKNPEGFATADLAEMLEDGRFLLKGRSDSIVKIEEKRISLTEVENRIMQTGLVKEVKVVALSNDVRQFLAAALVLNEEGVKKFADTEKYLVNRWFHDFLMQFFENVVLPKKWRYLEKLPCDVQGKVHKNEIIALFL